MKSLKEVPLFIWFFALILLSCFIFGILSPKSDLHTESECRKRVADSTACVHLASLDCLPESFWQGPADSRLYKKEFIEPFEWQAYDLGEIQMADSIWLPKRLVLFTKKRKVDGWIWVHLWLLEKAEQYPQRYENRVLETNSPQEWDLEKEETFYKFGICLTTYIPIPVWMIDACRKLEQLL